MAEKTDKLRFYFVTWNVATKYPEQDLHQLLGIGHNNAKELPDFYVVGLQEVKAQPQNMVMGMFTDDPWTKSLRETLKEHDYIKVRNQRLQGLVLNIFCQRQHLTHLRLIEAQFTRTGFGGMWGNKGAVSVRLNIYGVSICVVNSHLTPHDHLLAERISDYNVILNQHLFTTKDTSSIFYHDYVFWIGDLNFRLNGEELSAEEIDLLVKKNQLDLLLDKDQLMAVMHSGEAFSELIENDIKFPPTYKYEFGSQEFDFKRRPSWTDRILYKVNTDVYEGIRLKATQSTYTSHPSYVQSDHKPVTGEFEITIRADYEDQGVTFLPLTEWFIDEENSVSYKLTGSIGPSCGDWIGLFRNGFTSLDEYIVYEYVARGRSDVGSAPPETDSITDRIYFSYSALQAPGMYQLVYVRQNGSTVGILGVSPPFPGYRRLQSNPL
ncbi:inositol polyphosphate 5-phosphatase K-like isoform X1 [Neodiprion fabricii]|uniref:inositol polyphosphate 5-phosphatase K-like isoform X1 n=1 Tax=Neodiprion fabricii TaxID=2872261 RepID=UPI001ED8D32A|nr:inositol polyphosphate 5-phosphatase K-like isoform X1 [Neodiprion fabricii]